MATGEQDPAGGAADADEDGTDGAGTRGQRYGGTDEAGDMAPANRGGTPDLAGVRPPPTGTSGTPPAGGTGPAEAPPPSRGAARNTGVPDAPTTPGAGSAVSASDVVDAGLGPTDQPAAGA
jgi:hypothetical protein